MSKSEVRAAIEDTALVFATQHGRKTVTPLVRLRPRSVHRIAPADFAASIRKEGLCVWFISCGRNLMNAEQA
jgi:hypothetical protein